MAAVPPEDNLYQALYTTHVNGGPYYKHVSFANQSDYGRWIAIVTEIKETIAKINQDKDEGRWPCMMCRVTWVCVSSSLGRMSEWLIFLPWVETIR